MQVMIKPLSVNDAWQGRRFKTPAYRQYERDLLMVLPPYTIPKGELLAIYEFGLSSKLCDWDNPVKPFQDVLQQKYQFDDRRIVDAWVRKRLVSKGEEYVDFELLPVAAGRMQ